MLKDDVLAVQRNYPQVYLACHTRHERASSNRYRVSAHDSAILSHLSENEAVGPATLAEHLAIARSSLSATIRRLGRLGYLKREPRKDDRRRVDLLLTPMGREALAGASVLETRRVERLLSALSPSERQRAIERDKRGWRHLERTYR